MDQFESTISAIKLTISGKKKKWKPGASQGPQRTKQAQTSSLLEHLNNSNIGSQLNCYSKTEAECSASHLNEIAGKRKNNTSGGYFFSTNMVLISHEFEFTSNSRFGL